MYLLVVLIRVLSVGDTGLCYSLIPHKENGKKCYMTNDLLKGVIKKKNTKKHRKLTSY